VLRIEAEAVAELVDAGNQADARGRTWVAGALAIRASNAPDLLADTLLVTGGNGAGDAAAAVEADFTTADGSTEVKFGDKVRLADNYRHGGTAGHVYRYMGGTPVTLDLGEQDYGNAGYWIEEEAGALDEGVLGAMWSMAKDVLFIDLITNADPTGWTSLKPVRSGPTGTTEQQSLTLTLTPPAAGGGSFRLAAGEVQTDSIQVLALGRPQAEQQRLTLVNGDVAEGSNFRLSLAGQDDLDLTLAGDTAAQASALETALERWFGVDNVTVTAQAGRAAGWAFDIRLAGSAEGRDIGQIQARVLEPVGSRRLALQMETVRDGRAAPTRADQAALIQAALRKALAEPGLVVPHPRFRERLFVLEPLAELAADWIDPVSGVAVSELLQRARSRPS